MRMIRKAIATGISLAALLASAAHAGTFLAPQNIEFLGTGWGGEA